eukprot:CAMPEP_0170566972 /NCGR_PEP_ID=MMETSP0211-20121228/80183_1 /TAXON_ID=311385 /ORGANISM="Pseudokeronopsis sp., Strain OXSARD2" /LENGTH=98 /DNA_ID=CAMNT_0010888303 /DNA_START=869 /DNA_END=1165 /DNA_ORIENTATION=-
MEDKINVARGSNDLMIQYLVNQKYRMFSGLDHHIILMQQIFKLSEEIKRYPPSASSFLFEIYQQADSNEDNFSQFYIKIYYNDIPVELPGGICKDYRC